MKFESPVHPRRDDTLRRLWFARLTGLLAMLILPTVWASSPEATVRDATQSLIQAVEANRDAIERDPEQVKTLIEEFVAPQIDFQIMSRVILGQHWRSATPDQRARFVQAFRGFLVRFYTTAIKEYVVQEGIPEQVSVEVLPLRDEPSGRTTRVKSRILQNGRAPVEVTYGLYRTDQNGWRLIDIQIEGISLVINYRQSFSRELQTSGLDDLIANLEARDNPA